MNGPLSPGIRFAEDRTFAQAEFDAFARLSGDDNPIHVDPAFSASTRFGRTVAHGMLLYSAVWGLLRRRFPGYGCATQELMFPAPTFAGEPMILEATIETVEPDGRLDVATQLRHRDGGMATLVGRATLIALPAEDGS